MSDPESVTLRWCGNDGWIISSGSHAIGIDLDLLNELRKAPPPVPIEEIAAGLDYLFVTHDHGDHFNVPTCSELARLGNARFILPESCRSQFEESDIPEDRALWVAPRNRYDPEAWLSFETLRALHGYRKQTVYERANMADCGYLIEFAGRKFFQPGDTVLLSEHLELSDIDVLFVSPTEHNTYIDDSLLLIESIDPATVVAQHFDTYSVSEANSFWTVGYPNEVKERLPAKLAERMIIPVAGAPIAV